MVEYNFRDKYSSSSRVSSYQPSAALSVLETPVPVAPRPRSIRLANGVNIYYTEAGDPNNPTILLLHGFPASSSYFRNIIPLLVSSAYNFHVIAPDLPGFGATECPDSYTYTFQKLAETIVLLIDVVDIGNFAIYCMGEYGTLVALKVIQFKLENTIGLVIQNGTVYNEGRLDSSLLDIYKTGLSIPPSRNSSFSNLTESSETHLQSSLVSRRPSNTSLFSDASCITNARPGGRVTFGLSIEQFAVDRANSVHVSSTSHASSVNGRDYDDEDDEDEDEEDDQDEDDEEEDEDSDNTQNHITPGLALNDENMRQVEFELSSFKKPMGTVQVTIDQIKTLYLPVKKPTTPSLHRQYNFSFNNSSSKPRDIDPHAYLMDYYFLLRPGQAEVQRQLYKDFLKHRKPFPLSSPVNMWLRTTNTPILVLWGTNDPLLSQEITLENFKRDCRHCEVKVFENGGHYALEYYPDEIALAIHEFFNNGEEKIWAVTTY